MSSFDSLTPKELIVLANLVAFVITDERSSRDNILLGDFLSTVASIVSTLAAQQENLETLEKNKNNLSNIYTR